jgi:hypothetical protein
MPSGGEVWPDNTFLQRLSEDHDHACSLVAPLCEMTSSAILLLEPGRLRVKGGIVLDLPEKAALGSQSRHGAHGIARNLGQPPAFDPEQRLK